MSEDAPDLNLLAPTGAMTSQPPAGTPTKNAPARVIVTMALSRFGWAYAIAVPSIATLALRAQQLAGPDRAVAVLGGVASVGALTALVSNPIIGRLSDRTRGRWGRRRPWLVAGAIGMLLGLLFISLAPSVPMLIVAIVFNQICYNVYGAPQTATLADQVPPRQRGLASGLIGAFQNAGPLAAAYTFVYFNQSVLMLAIVPGVIGLVLMLLFAFVLPDRPLDRRPASEGGLKTVLMTFWVSPRKHPDFAWAWVSRFLIVLATFMFTTFRLFYLEQEMHLAVKEAAQVMATGILVYTLALFIGTFGAGWLSDKVKRRKIFIFVSAIIFAVGMAVLSFAHSPGAFWGAEVVLGLGFGVYVGVDLALVVDVLPNPDEAAKDLGVFNIALAGPQALAPAVAAALIGTGGGNNYVLMLIGAAVLAFLGALAILPVKAVR